jgi:hypothetical protein
MKYLKAIGLIAVVALVFSCAATPPQKDIDAANKTFSDVQAAKADVYAPTEFQAAQDAKNALDAELAAQAAKTSGKSYSKTSDLVKALQTASKTALDAATANVATFKNDVATLLTDSQTALTAVQSELQAATKSPKLALKAKLNLKALTAQVAADQQAITDGSAANDSQDYATAKTKLSAAKDDLTQVQGKLEAAGYKAQ